jgi:hypothetical protein
MNAINRNFRVVKAVEVVFIVLGLLLAVLFPHPSAKVDYVRCSAIV